MINPATEKQKYVILNALRDNKISCETIEGIIKTDFKTSTDVDNLNMRLASLIINHIKNSPTKISINLDKIIDDYLNSFECETDILGLKSLEILYSKTIDNDYDNEVYDGRTLMDLIRKYFTKNLEILTDLKTYKHLNNLYDVLSSYMGVQSFTNTAVFKSKVLLIFIRILKENKVL